jgi:signal peptidase II
MKKILKDYTFLFIIAGSLILLDQLSKHLVRTQLAFTEQWAPWDWMLPYARIVHWNNTGAAFGILQGMSIVFTILAFIVSFSILYYYPRVPRENWLMRVALSMMLAGAVGNLIDRLRFGTVTDFISVGNFAVWNVADASITVGVILLALDLWLQERKERQGKNQDPLHETGKE